MKKKYIRPESRLYVINLSESIASSGQDGSGDIMQGNSVIKFHQGGDGCRLVYTNESRAPVGVGGDADFSTYYEDMYNLVVGDFTLLGILMSCYTVV